MIVMVCRYTIILILISILSITLYHHTTPHHTLPRVNLSDSLPDTQLLTSPGVCGDGGGDGVDILTLVHSAVENVEARENIRDSWGRDKTSLGIVSVVVFILGVSNNATEQQQLQQESLLHGDIVQGEFLDTYRNMSYKNLLGLHWVTLYCSKVKMIVKTDDDYFVDLYGIHHIAQELLANPAFRNGSLLACPMLVNSKVFRDFNDPYTGRWAISESELPPARLSKWQKKGSKRDFYPTYCTGIHTSISCTTITDYMLS